MLSPNKNSVAIGDKVSCSVKGKRQVMIDRYATHLTDTTEYHLEINRLEIRTEIKRKPEEQSL